jgi:hypothetical protein
LNEKIAENYGIWIKKQLKSENDVIVSMYSQKEFELTMEGLKKSWNINDEIIREMELREIGIDGVMITLSFNRKKKNTTDRFAKIVFKEENKNNTHSLERDLHYGLFILGTEKHESRRIDNQLR